MDSKEYVSSTSEEDEIVAVTLPLRDYKIMRELIEERRSLNWLGKWFKHFLLVAAGGFIALMTFGDSIKQWMLRALQ